MLLRVALIVLCILLLSALTKGSFCRNGQWEPASEQETIVTPDLTLGNPKFFAAAHAYSHDGRFVTATYHSDDDPGRVAGALFVYDLNPATNAYELTQTLIPSHQDVDYSTVTSFTSFAIWNDTIVVGNDGWNNYEGAAWIFKLEAGVWNEVRWLDEGLYTDIGQSQTRFGGAVAANELMTLVSSGTSPNDKLLIFDPETAADVGNITVDPYGFVVNLSYLTIKLSGSTIFLGYYYYFNGYMTVLEETFVGSGVWTQSAYYEPVYSAEKTYSFGAYAEFLNPDLLIVGWEGSLLPRFGTGASYYIFAKDSDQTWDTVNKILLPAYEDTDHMYGDMILDGHPSFAQNGSIIVLPSYLTDIERPRLQVEAGVVVVYEQVGYELQWEATTIFTMPTPLSHVHFGSKGTILTSDRLLVFQYAMDARTDEIYPDGVMDAKIWSMVQMCGCEDESVCQNGATCQADGPSSYSCACVSSQFTGDHCEIDIEFDDCASSPCADNEYCVDLWVGHDCEVDFATTYVDESDCFAQCGCDTDAQPDLIKSHILQKYWPETYNFESSVSDYAELCSEVTSRLNYYGVYFFYNFRSYDLNTDNFIKTFDASPAADLPSDYSSYWPLWKHDRWEYTNYSASAVIGLNCTRYKIFLGSEFEETLSSVICPDANSTDCARGCECTLTATDVDSCFEFCSTTGTYDAPIVHVRDSITWLASTVQFAYSWQYDQSRIWGLSYSKDFYEYSGYWFSSVCYSSSGEYSSGQPSYACFSGWNWAQSWEFDKYYTKSWAVPQFVQTPTFKVTGAVSNSYITPQVAFGDESRVSVIDHEQKEFVADGGMGSAFENCMLGCQYRDSCPDFCRESPCSNGGVCKNENGGFCECADGYEGEFCASMITSSSSSSFMPSLSSSSPSIMYPSSSSSSNSSSSTVSTPSGSSSVIDDVDDACVPNPCQNNGTCIMSENFLVAECVCDIQWRGPACAESAESLSLNFSLSADTIVDLDAYLYGIKILLLNSTGFNNENVQVSATQVEDADGDVFYFFEIHIYADDVAEITDAQVAIEADPVFQKAKTEGDGSVTTVDTAAGTNKNDVIIVVVLVAGGLLALIGVAYTIVRVTRNGRKRIRDPKTNKEYVMPV